MNLMRHHSSIRKALQVSAVGALSILFAACTASVPIIGRQASSQATIIEFKHSQSEETSDCLAVCADMVLQYYGIYEAVPDSVLPLDLMELSNSLNSRETLDDSGHILFSAVMGMTTEDITKQIENQRPLIIAFRPTASEEYHSVVITGADPIRKRFYVNDPASKKPGWAKFSSFPTFADSGVYLVMVIGMRET